MTAIRTTTGGVVKRRKKRQEEGLRETVESVAIAFILAFLFKTFQAEAYVIPTGSMAPTLYGRHKDVTCDGCGFSFAIGASSEVDQDSGVLAWRVDDAYCVNCGKHLNVRDAPVFNGDRILVNKQVTDYQRFDVVVFKNPEQGHVNYIKRLVGLPGETIRIRKGDVWAKLPGDDVFRIQRKQDPFVQKDIQLAVYDDRYPAREILDLGWPERWEPSVEGSGSDAIGHWVPAENGWSCDRNERTFALESGGSELTWLRYRHLLPRASSWPDPLQKEAEIEPARPSLISDFCTFNAYRQRYGWADRTEPTGIYWTGDLTINAQVNVKQIHDGGEFVLQLVEGPETFTCRINLQSGHADVRVTPSETPLAEGEMLCSGSTAMNAVGEYTIAFANVDDRICLWVNDELIEFEGNGEYDSSDMPQPTQRDLAPCGLAVRNAGVQVSELVLQRDIYYRDEAFQFSEEDGLSLDQNPEHEVRDEVTLQQLLNDPEAWAQRYREEALIQIEKFGRYTDYSLADDEYLMFGDNSSMSKDSRLFDFQTRPMNGIYSHRYAVREQDLIGKALFIFWPHGVPFLNDGRGYAVKYHSGPDVHDPKTYTHPTGHLPFYPNLPRMRKIR
ncbi:MAG: signal peptidase I [Planctomycetaceae bacterium]